MGYIRADLGALVTGMVMRRKYISAYRKAIQMELKKRETSFFRGITLRLSDNDQRMKEKEEKEKEGFELYRELIALHQSLSVAAISAHRNFVLTLLHRQGSSLASLKEAVRSSAAKCAAHYELHCTSKEHLTDSADDSSSLITPLPSLFDNNRSNPTLKSILKDNPARTSTSQQLSDTHTDKHADRKTDKHTDTRTSGHHSEDHHDQVDLAPTFQPVAKNQTLSVRVSVRVSRLAVTVLEESPLNGSQTTHRTTSPDSISPLHKKMNGENVRSVLSLVVYGTDITARAAGDYDKALSVRIGSVRAYGVMGVEMLCCGSDPNTWMEEADAKGTATVSGVGGGVGKGSGSMTLGSLREYAADATVRLICSDIVENIKYGAEHQHEDEDSGDNSDHDHAHDESHTNSTPTPNPSSTSNAQHNLVTEVTATLLTVTWDTDTMRIIRSLHDQLSLSLLSSCILEHTGEKGGHPYAADRLKAALISMSKTVGQEVEKETRCVS